MHTGTRFVVNTLLDPVGYRGVRHSHIHDLDPVKILLAKCSPVFVPIRHPYRTVYSWVKRKKDPALLIEQWENLRTFVDALDLHYIPIDTPDRDDNIARINEQLGIAIDPAGWIPISPSAEPPGFDFTAQHSDIVKHELEANQDFWGRWYS